MLNVKLRIMKKRNLLKLLFTAVAIFAVGFANAQPYVPYNEMSASSADGITDSLVVDTDPVPYYVEPDPVLNNLSAAYDPSQPNSGQGITSTFDWSGTAAEISLTEPSAGAEAPYRTVTSSTEGTHAISVKEVSENGCGDAAANTQDITFIPTPEYTISTTEYEVCDGNSASIVIAGITAGLNNGGRYYFLLDSEKAMYDAADNKINGTDIYNHTDTIIALNTGVGDLTATGSVNLIDNKTFYANEHDSKKRITKHIYTIKGLNHHISRKGAFITLKNNTEPQLDVSTYNETTGEYNMDEGLYAWYDADGSKAADVNTTTQEITVTVYPTPTTGTIHFVPNNYEL